MAPLDTLGGCVLFTTYDVIKIVLMSQDILNKQLVEPGRQFKCVSTVFCWSKLKNVIRFDAKMVGK